MRPDLNLALARALQIRSTEELTRKLQALSPHLSTSQQHPQCLPPLSRNFAARQLYPMMPHITRIRITHPPCPRLVNSLARKPSQTGPPSFQETAPRQELRNKQKPQASLPGKLKTTQGTKKIPHAPLKSHTPAPQLPLSPKLRNTERD